MIVVCDASSLVALATCHCLDLLVKIYEEVYITQEVFAEVTVRNKPYATELKEFFSDKICSISLSDTLANYQKLNLPLDMGEMTAMALYQELEADYLLIDEKLGRKIAAEMGMEIIGSLGVLALGKRFGYIENIRPFTDILIQSPIFISPQLIEMLLTQMDE